MIEYCIFPSGPDAKIWSPPFTVYAISDEAVRSAFPNADRIYRNSGASTLVRVV